MWSPPWVPVFSNAETRATRTSITTLTIILVEEVLLFYVRKFVPFPIAETLFFFRDRQRLWYSNSLAVLLGELVGPMQTVCGSHIRHSRDCSWLASSLWAGRQSDYYLRGLVTECLANSLHLRIRKHRVGILSLRDASTKTLSLDRYQIVQEQSH